MDGDDVNYSWNELGGESKMETLSVGDLLDPENEELLEDTLIDDDNGEEDIPEDFFHNDGESTLDPNDPRNELIDKLKDKSGYNDAKERLMEKAGLRAPAEEAATDAVAGSGGAASGAAGGAAATGAGEAAAGAAAGEAAGGAAAGAAAGGAAAGAAAGEAGATGLAALLLNPYVWIGIAVTLAVCVLVILILFISQIKPTPAAGSPAPTGTTPGTGTTTPAGPVAQRAVTIAVGELGKGYTRGNNCGGDTAKYQSYAGCLGCGDSYPWCAAFVSWVFHEASGTNKIRTCGSKAALNSFPIVKSINSEIPKPGDVVWRSRGGGLGHIAIVEKVVGSTLYTIEGNAASKVIRKSYSNYGRGSWSSIGRWQ